MICSHHPPPPLGKTYPPLNRPNPPKNCYWSQSPLTEDFLITPVPPPPLNTGGSHYEMAFVFDRKALEAVEKVNWCHYGCDLFRIASQRDGEKTVDCLIVVLTMKVGWRK